MVSASFWPVFGPSVPVKGIVRPILLSHQCQKPLVLLQLRSVDAHVPIFAGEYAVGKQAKPHSVAGAPTGYAPVNVSGQVVSAEQYRCHLAFGHINQLTLSGRVSA